ncbi:MAG: hypothetical protein ACYC3I_01895 [Gemmataceae bacterium]
MRSTKYFVMAVMALAFAAGLGVFQAADDAKPKYTIEEVMEKAHKGKPSLFQRVVKDKASEEQRKKLVEYYEVLAQNKPEKGSAADWKKRTTALVKAVKEVEANNSEETRGKLAKAADCKGCHKLHKGD